MAKFKIMTIAHCLKNNRIAKFGDEVDETQLTSPFGELVNAGFIELVDEALNIETISENVSKEIKPSKFPKK